MPHNYHTESIIWNNITIEIRYCKAWLSSDVDGYNTAHLEIEAVNHARARLPMTETGYRSHFCQHNDIIAHGGAVEFVKAWLEHKAQSSEWKAYADTSRQGELF